MFVGFGFAGHGRNDGVGGRERGQGDQSKCRWSVDHCGVPAGQGGQLVAQGGGDLGQMGLWLLGSADTGRKIQLRMNQLGIKLRKLKRKRGS